MILSQYLASSCAVNGLNTKHNTLICMLLTLVAGKQRRLFVTGDDNKMFMTSGQSTLCRR